ncbi:MAG: hypothetical protein OXU70_17675 [Gammaproteobacteria bacterium]|nr:hypothetical protein [Gammaproteobacteria bacterium]
MNDSAPEARPARRNRLIVAAIGRCGLLTLLAVLSPVQGYAAEAGIDVPMRRDRATSQQPLSTQSSGGLLEATEVVRREIGILRSELGANDFPAQAESHQDRTPIHVYVKALEVMAKVAALQRRLGVPVGEVRSLPLSDVSADEAMGAVQDILDGIDAIKKQLVIDASVEVAATSDGPRMLAVAYRNLADASLLIDWLVGRELTLQAVFQSLMAAVEDINLIATRVQVPLNGELPEVSDQRNLINVAQQAMRAAYKVANLQTGLGMDASAVPTLTMVRVSPTEVHDLIGILRAELVRIKGHLGINVPTDEVPAAGFGQDSADLFAQMLLVVRHLDQLVVSARSQ